MLYVYAGGLVGYNSAGGEIRKSFAAVEASASGKYDMYLGGFVGVNNATSSISESYATGEVTAQALGAGGIIPYVGGFVGVNDGGSDVKDCYATGNVKLLPSTSTRSVVGGFVGYNGGAVISPLLIPTVRSRRMRAAQINTGAVL